MKTTSLGIVLAITAAALLAAAPARSGPRKQARRQAAAVRRAGNQAMIIQNQAIKSQQRAVRGQVGAIIAAQDRMSDPRTAVAIPWSLAAGEPTVPAGSPAGFWIWHSGDTIFLGTTSRSKNGLWFSGEIEAEGGVITNGRTILFDRRDAVAHPRPDRVEFRFRTARHLDGIKFNVSGGRFLTFRLTINGLKTDRIFVGASQTPAGGDPVVFDGGR